MDMEQLSAKYKLSKEDYWKHKQSGKWILTHDGCSKIGNIENIEMIDMEICNSERDFVRVIVTMKKGNVIAKTFGEADSKNSFNPYPGCMAEKRGRDRAILKLINAYEFGIYSEVEAEEFEKAPAEKPQGGSNKGSQPSLDSPSSFSFTQEPELDFVLKNWENKFKDAHFPYEKSRATLMSTSLDSLERYIKSDNSRTQFLAKAKIIYNDYKQNGVKNGIA